MGADVIKVEEPGAGDYMRWMAPLVGGQSAAFNALNRNKRSLTLNLKSDPGRELFKRLVEQADVVVEGNRPGVMDRLGLGWEVLRHVKPTLVMCSITGYGQTGPLASQAGHDINYMAVAGALSLTGSRQGPPLPLGIQVADIGGGGQGAATAILAALLGVARGGRGRHLDVSMTEGALSWISTQVAAHHAAGENAERSGQRLSGRYACYRVYRCADGGYFSVGALEPKFWAALCEAIGRPQLTGRQYAEGIEQERLQSEMENIFASRTRLEWELALAGLEVCCEPVLELGEVAAHPQISSREMLRLGPMGLEVAPPVRLNAQWRRLDPPGLGEHTDEILNDIGVDSARLAQLRSEGAI